MTEDVFPPQDDTLNVGRSAVRSLNATVAHVEQSAVQRLSAETVHAAGSAIGIANASTADIKASSVGVVAGDYVKVEESRVLVLLAPRVSGNVKAFFTLPAAFAFGAGYFIARAAVRAVFDRSGR
jgi:hypothetical protein